MNLNELFNKQKQLDDYIIKKKNLKELTYCQKRQ